ncbi:MAG: YggT family protein [bacterium]
MLFTFIVERLFQLVYVLLIIRVVLSWIPNVNYYHPVIHFIFRVTSLILDPIRRVVPPVAGLDLSPLVAIVLLQLLLRLLRGL